RLLRMDVGNVVLADDDLRVDARFVDAAEDLDDTADGTARRRGPARDLDDDHVVGLGGRRLSRGNMNVGGDTAIERHDIRETSGVGLKASDDGVVGALQNPNETSFETARRLALDADKHAVTVHRLCQVRRWNVDVVPLPGLRSVWHDEAETGRIGVQASG